MNEFYTVEEVANMFKVKPLTIYRLIKKEYLKSIKVGSVIRISKEDLEEFKKQYNV